MAYNYNKDNNIMKSMWNQNTGSICFTSQGVG
jgi:hypothetical protein